uniref:Putative secreted protein n=1 Tax=Anopheles marajoara TaxID=58244 RepID=A0A2M4CF00_9DIPT
MASISDRLLLNGLLMHHVLSTSCPSGVSWWPGRTEEYLSQELTKSPEHDLLCCCLILRLVIVAPFLLQKYG